MTITIASQQIVVSYMAQYQVNEMVPLQQLAFPFEFNFVSGLINVSIAGSSINIFTTPPFTFGGSEVYSGILADAHECVGSIDEVVLMGPSCSSLKMYETQGFYSPPSPSCYDGVSVRWTYATLAFACTTALSLLGVVVMIACYWKLKRNPETRALLANSNFN
jgi:hypothetical protein